MSRQANEGSSPEPASVDAMVERLREISAKLREPDLPDEEAERLAREASDLVARGGALIDERLREVAERGAPDPDQGG